MSQGLPTKIERSRTAGFTLDVFDHLGVVVGGQERLARAARRHWNVADEVREPRQFRIFQLRMLVPVVIDVPGLVSDDEVIAALHHRVLKLHEIGDQNFVHAADGLESNAGRARHFPARCRRDSLASLRA